MRISHLIKIPTVNMLIRKINFRNLNQKIKIRNLEIGIKQVFRTGGSEHKGDN